MVFIFIEYQWQSVIAASDILLVVTWGIRRGYHWTRSLYNGFRFLDVTCRYSWTWIYFRFIIHIWKKPGFVMKPDLAPVRQSNSRRPSHYNPPGHPEHQKFRSDLFLRSWLVVWMEWALQHLWCVNSTSQSWGPFASHGSAYFPTSSNV